MTVIASRSSPVAGPSSGRCFDTGSSKSTLPSSTRSATAAAVNVFVIDATWKRVAASNGDGASTFVTPTAAVKHSPSTTMPAADPAT